MYMGTNAVNKLFMSAQYQNEDNKLVLGASFVICAEDYLKCSSGIPVYCVSGRMVSLDAKV